MRKLVRAGSYLMMSLEMIKDVSKMSGFFSSSTIMGDWVVLNSMAFLGKAHFTVIKFALSKKP